MSNICETRSDLVNTLQSAVDFNASKKQNQLDKLWIELQQNKNTFETVIFTLNRCLDTSNLGFNFGSKLQMNSLDLMECVNKFNKHMNNDVPKIDWEHYNHPNFIDFINDITTNVLGKEFTYHKGNSDGWTSVLKIDNLTIGEQLKYVDSWYWREYWFVFLIFLPVTIVYYLLATVGYCIDFKCSFKCRDM